MFTDSETGEYVNNNYTFSPNTNSRTKATSTQLEFNLETGEKESLQNETTIRKRKTRFAVPRKFLAKPEETKHCCIDPNENYTLFAKDQVMTLQEVSWIQFVTVIGGN